MSSVQPVATTEKVPVPDLTYGYLEKAGVQANSILNVRTWQKRTFGAFGIFN
jgi:hypothetical protein